MCLTTLPLIRKREGSGSIMAGGQLSLLKVGKRPTGVMCSARPLTLLRGGKPKTVYTWSKYACHHGWRRRWLLKGNSRVLVADAARQESLSLPRHFPHLSSFLFLCLYMSFLVLLSSLSPKHPFLGARPRAGEV